MRFPDEAEPSGFKQGLKMKNFYFFYRVDFFPPLRFKGRRGSFGRELQSRPFLFFQNHMEEALARFLRSADENFNSWQSYEMEGYCYFEMREKDGPCF